MAASELREKVARAICLEATGFTDASWPNWLSEAAAAITLVLEEAAKVAEEYMETQNFVSDDEKGGARMASIDIAEGIRSLKETDNDV